MRKRVSVSALIVIIFSEFVGLFGIISVNHYNKIYTETYANLTDRSYAEKIDSDEIKILVSQYEGLMSSYVSITEDYKAKPVREKLFMLELKLRKQIMEHGKYMKMNSGVKEKYDLFRIVNDDVLTYLNYNAVLISNKGQFTKDQLFNYLMQKVVPLVDNLNESVDKLEVMSNHEMEETRTKLEANKIRSQVITVASTCLMIFSLFFVSIHSGRILYSLEMEKEAFKFRHEIDKLHIDSIQHKTIMGVADLIEGRSGETGQHVKRTSRYVEMILKQAKKDKLWNDILNDRYADLVTRAAPLHDLGKITISDAVLNKPGKLTPEEFEIMKTHAAAGADIVDKILGGIEDEEYIEIAKEIAHYHHEKWNGKGYPEGRKNVEIPLCARIMAVADVFDALVSERCYKKPMSYEDAFNLIRNESGEHFDPDVVRVFMEIRKQIEGAANENK